MAMVVFISQGLAQPHVLALGCAWSVSFLGTVRGTEEIWGFLSTDMIREFDSSWIEVYEGMWVMRIELYLDISYYNIISLPCQEIYHDIAIRSR